MYRELLGEQHFGRELVFQRASSDNLQITVTGRVTTGEGLSSMMGTDEMTGGIDAERTYVVVDAYSMSVKGWDSLPIHPDRVLYDNIIHTVDRATPRYNGGFLLGYQIMLEG